jgi:hypothetical protein
MCLATGRNISTKRERVSLAGANQLTRWRFVLVLLARQDGKKRLATSTASAILKELKRLRP